KKGAGYTPPGFFHAPCIPDHHPDETASCGCPGPILVALCLSVSTGAILMITRPGATGPGTGQQRQITAALQLKYLTNQCFIYSPRNHSTGSTRLYLQQM
ncbi:hypothetical protein, partial [Stutzerimonas balearica]|uniref:hypothetical protein n=1 Tax=Stutzerimonas balearica TaxID=74829 RepID=UPI00289C5263